MPMLCRTLWGTAITTIACVLNQLFPPAYLGILFLLVLIVFLLLDIRERLNEN